MWWFSKPIIIFLLALYQNVEKISMIKHHKCGSQSPFIILLEF